MLKPCSLASPIFLVRPQYLITWLQYILSECLGYYIHCICGICNVCDVLRFGAHVLRECLSAVTHELVQLSEEEDWLLLRLAPCLLGAA